MATQTANTKIDPVCGMEVRPDQSAGTSEHGGATYYFCSPGCKTKFDRNPQQFTTEKERERAGGGCC